MYTKQYVTTSSVDRKLKDKIRVVGFTCGSNCGLGHPALSSCQCVSFPLSRRTQQDVRVCRSQCLSSECVLTVNTQTLLTYTHPSNQPKKHSVRWIKKGLIFFQTLFTTQKADVTRLVYSLCKRCSKTYFCYCFFKRVQAYWHTGYWCVFKMTKEFDSDMSSASVKSLMFQIKIPLGSSVQLAEES